MTDRVAILHDTGLFDGLDVPALHALARACTLQRLDRGQTLFDAGDPADGLRVVLDGLIRVWIGTPAGREVTVALAEPGDLLGEIALLDGAPRSAGATAMEPATILFLPRVAFRAAFDAFPDLRTHLIGVVCARLRALTGRFGAATLLTLRARVAGLLHDLAQSHATAHGPGARFRRRFGQAELAAMLGVTREATNKQLAALTADGLVAMDGGVLWIPDLAALADAS
ncbi:Crp/Fnr family transcriptional regulator [Jannaschia sp. LMIT008]|uniref:Crp/Fnr family transcriptional regulator n=1 Tax=Jannaschia maritima TaxID=3032585 RepID=UPI0028128DAC|nr:Crp/Fnr family transcriptional regulator [Jannaschia sp. LMIT008]